MPQRTQTRDSDEEFADLLGDDSESAAQSTGTSSGYRARFKRRAAEIFAPRFFLLAAVVLTVAMFVGGMVTFGATFVGLLAVFAASFVLGGVTSDSRILETATGGAVAAGLAFLLKSLTLAIATGGGVNVAAIGAGAGFVVAALGAYLGGDLRDGLLKDL